MIKHAAKYYTCSLTEACKRVDINIVKILIEHDVENLSCGLSVLKNKFREICDLFDQKESKVLLFSLLIFIIII